MIYVEIEIFLSNFDINITRYLLKAFFFKTEHE